MASKKRVRIFAGPNGSGKSSLFRGFQQEIKEKTGFFVNADEIELIWISHRWLIYNYLVYLLPYQH